MQRALTSEKVKADRASRNRRSLGFTLVEVCMAMGIMSFTLIPLIGVMALGLGQVANNIDNNQAVNISQQVFIEARQMTYSTLSGKGTYYRYFSNSGDDLGTGTTRSATSLSAALQAQVAYTATVKVTPSALPGGDTTQSSVVTLSVQVRKTPGGIDPLPATTPGVSNFVGMISCEDLDYSGNSGI